MGALKNKQHEEFEVKENGRKKIIRQDRIDVTTSDCYIELREHKYKVINFSAFGLLVEMNSEFKNDFAEEEVPFIFENIEIEKLRLRLVRCILVAEGVFEVAFEVVGEPLKIERVRAVQQVHMMIFKNEERQKSYDKVPLDFQYLVLQAKESLSQLEYEINNLGNVKFISSTEEQDFEGTVSELVSDYFTNLFVPFYGKLGDFLRSQDEGTVKECFHFFREKMNSLLHKAPFADRSYNKPLGYAGDYEMMNLIYNSEMLGNSLYAKCLHQYFIEQPAAQAVRNRIEYLHKKIFKTIEQANGKPVKILSVASGPAKELQNLLKMSEVSGLENVEIHLLDQDVESLKHAQRRVIEIKRRNPSKVEVKFINKAIKNIIARGLDESKYDLIYSAGLFDYFSDPVAKMAAEKLFDGLNENGKLIIGNFSLENPTQSLMDMALDWYLIYRSIPDLQRLYSHISTLEVEKEEQGINLFAVIHKK